MLVTASPGLTVSYLPSPEPVQVAPVRERARDDSDCPGKTVYVALSLAPDPKGTQ